MSNPATTPPLPDDRAWLAVAPNSGHSAPRMRIFCIPHAGGSHLAFEKWPAFFGPEIEICTVKLPGRGPRFKEAALTDMDALSSTLAAVISGFADRPFAIFGECAGSLVALATATVLTDRYRRPPAQLFVASMPNPLLSYGRGVHRLPPDAFRAAIVAQGLIEPILAEDDEAIDFYAPQIRADFQISETYRLPDHASLTCPIVSFSSSRDPAGTAADYSAWQTLTTASWRHVESRLRLLSSDPADQIKTAIRDTLDR